MSDQIEPLVIVERGEHAATLTLNRPAKKNAMSDDLLEQLILAITEANEDDDIRAIIVKGAGTCFTSGRDTSQFEDAALLQDMSVDAAVDIFLEMLSMLIELPKPTIAAIHGMALGGGQAMSLACDFVVAERNARFGNVEMIYGFPAAMNIALLTRQIGRRRGLEIAMTGDLYSAEQYYAFGLVNRLAEPGALSETTAEFVRTLTNRMPWAVKRTKSTYRLAEDMPLQGALNFGNQLNQLLRLNGQLAPVHSHNLKAKQGLKADITE
ncbi:MAG: enoyl-CoA hydratase/isomerase family protein [Pseudomonadota bacterium]|nr:enoyl-CoA hydratase/isomerase family protein [Pseudomonadota bacterium]